MSCQSHAYDMQMMIDKHLQPTYQNLAEQTKELTTVANQYCENPNGANLDSLKEASRDAFLAWQAAQHIRFGPVLAFSRDRRFEFWPDKRGTVRKQLYNLVNDPVIHDKGFDIAKKSVAVQGFSALEQLLYVDSKDNAKTNCVLIVKITDNLHVMATDIYNDWSTDSNSFVELFKNPGKDNYIYRSDVELAGELINTLYTQLEVIITRKLDLPLGSSLDKARGKRSEAWRSEGALDAILANMKACHEFYQYSFAPQLRGNPLHQNIVEAFEAAQETLEEIDVPLMQAVAIEDQRILVQQLRQELSLLKKLMANDLADTLGISLGFNSLDGD
ncbi:MAG: imelysin family protein [Gammaproteobacteria bacterium]